MRKRKRVHYAKEDLDPMQEIELKKGDIAKKLVHGKKVLHRAFKTAKGFERQKLGKRIKSATDKQDIVEVGRLQTELDVLRVLDLSSVVDSYLYKTLLKSKGIIESGLVLGNVKLKTKLSTGTPDELSAVANITARLYNTRLVKEAMSYILGSIYAIIGIDIISAIKKNRSTESGVPGRKEGERIKPIRDSSGEDNVRPSQIKDAMDFPPENTDFNSQSDIESKDLSRYDALVHNSSDGESEDATFRRPRLRATRSSHPILALPPGSQCSLSSPSPPTLRKSVKKSLHGSSKPSSKFLPTLMGGYWSGSESATDEDASGGKKNRPGQQARRAMWEKKFGTKANHLKASANSRDTDWDPRRGARSENEREFREERTGRKAGKPVFVKDKVLPTGKNADFVKPRRHRDDTGPLHPSWEAAKRAKQVKQTAEFQGKKIVFK